MKTVRLNIIIEWVHPMWLRRIIDRDKWLDNAEKLNLELLWVWENLSFPLPHRLRWGIRQQNPFPLTHSLSLSDTLTVDVHAVQTAHHSTIVESRVYWINKMHRMEHENRTGEKSITKAFSNFLFTLTHTHLRAASTSFIDVVLGFYVCDGVKPRKQQQRGIHTL